MGVVDAVVVPFPPSPVKERCRDGGGWRWLRCLLASFWGAVCVCVTAGRKGAERQQTERHGRGEAGDDDGSGKLGYWSGDHFQFSSSILISDCWFSLRPEA